MDLGEGGYLIHPYMEKSWNPEFPVTCGFVAQHADHRVESLWIWTNIPGNGMKELQLPWMNSVQGQNWKGCHSGTAGGLSGFNSL